MKNLIIILILVGMVIVSAGITQWVVRGKAEAEGSYMANVCAVRMEFAKNNSVLRPIVDHQGRPDLQKYLDEVNTLMGWYFKNPVAKLWEQYKDRNDPESVIKEKRRLAEEEGPRKRSAKGNLPILEECYKLTREIYEEIKQGSYTAAASDFNGSVRLDVHSVKKVMTERGPQLRWETLVWGGIGPIVYGGWHMKLFKTPSAEEQAQYQKELAQAKKVGRELETKDPVTLHFGESASATGHPVLPDFEGADYIVDFPPGVLVNYWDMPVCPPDADFLQMEFKLRSRPISGEDQQMSFLFKLPVDASWKGSWDGVQKIEAASDYQ